EVVKAGNQELAIREWGDVILLINTPTGTEQIELTYVAYVPGFLTNVVGLSRCRSIGIHFDSGRDCLYQRRWNNVISKLQYVGGHWLIDADGMERPDAGPLLAASTHAYKKPSHEPRKPLRLTLEEAHVMWGHAGRQAIGHLPGSVDGLELVDGEQAPKWKDCDTCIQSKLTQLVSRRLPREPATRPFQRTSIDLIQLLERGERCYNGDQYLFHMVDQDSKWHEGSCMPDKTKATLTRVFKRLLAKIERQYNSQVIVIRLDMEAGYVELLEICKNLGIALEPRATEAQNGGIERAGKSIVIRARAVRLHAGLPEEYANECAMTAIYLLNHKLCDGQGQYAEKSYIREVAEVLDIENTPDYSNILTDQLSSPEDVNVQQDAHRSENDMEDEIEDPISDTIHVQPRRRTNQQDDSQQQETMRHLRTPEATSESQEVSQLTDQEMDDTGWERGYALAPEGEALNRTSNNARRREEISSQQQGDQQGEQYGVRQGVRSHSQYQELQRPLYVSNTLDGQQPRRQREQTTQPQQWYPQTQTRPPATAYREVTPFPQQPTNRVPDRPLGLPHDPYKTLPPRWSRNDRLEANTITQFSKLWDNSN
ncbi:flavin-binding monooxygenase protein, partial [Pyrenophora tritici-repentis]